MTIMDFTIAGSLSAAGLVMSNLGLTVPAGFEALHFISATAMASGYVVGRELSNKTYSIIRTPVIIFLLSIVSCLCCLLYYFSISYLSPGIMATIVLSTLSFFTFFPFSLLLSLARSK
jgi:hypothetical protein